MLRLSCPRSLIRCLVVAVALQLAGPASAAEPLPVSYFTRHDVIGTAKISPDGEAIALTAGRYGREALHFLQLEDMEPIGGVRASEGDELWRFDWVSSTRAIFSLAERHFGRARPTGTGEIFAIDRDGSRRELIYGYRAGESQTGTRLPVREASKATGELLSRLRDDDEHILITEYPWRRRGNFLVQDFDAYPRVARLDVYDGDKRPLHSVPLASADVLIDQADRVRFGIGLNESGKLGVVWKPEPDADWEAFDLPGLRENSVIPRAFSPDNRSVFLTGVAEGESLNALYQLDLTNGTLERRYQHHEAEIEAVVTDLTETEVVGVRVHADKPEYHWLDEHHPAAVLHRMLQQAFSGKAFWITSTTDDGRLALVFVYSDVNPGDYYLFDTEAKKADYLYGARGWVDPRRMRPKEPIIVESRDGLRLHGYLTRPRDDDGPYPLIVLPHGGPYGVRDRWEFDWEVQLLASRGYAVLQVNFRGSDGYGMNFAGAGIREWGGTMQDDLTDATRWAIDEGIAREGNVCIFGGSYGGYAALMGAVREPDLYACAIGHAGVYDLNLMFETGDIPTWRVGRGYLERVLGGDEELLRERSPAHNAEHIKASVMLVHGKDDERADYKQAERMKEALEKAGKPFVWRALGYEGHGIYDEETREEVYTEILGFLDEHLE